MTDDDPEFERMRADALIHASASFTRDLERRLPIPMLLYCPTCGLQHIDAPDERTPDWTNPPHRSHLCHGCGCIWRPADVPTEGVAVIDSAGSADNWTPGQDQCRSLNDAPHDGTMVWLLIDYGAYGTCPLADARRAWSIGFNQHDHDQDWPVDRWQYAGWNWEQDCFCNHETDNHKIGVVAGWKPIGFSLADEGA